MVDKSDEDIDYFMLHIQREIGKDALTGMSIWSERFTQYRNAGHFNLCERLLSGMKGYELPPYGRAVICYSEGWLNDRMGNWQEAITAYKAGLKAFNEVGLSGMDAKIWMQIGSLYQDQGLWDEAKAAYDCALSVDDEDARTRGLVMNNFGGLNLLQGRNEEALICFEEAISLLRTAGDRHNTAAALAGYGNALRDTGKIALAHEYLLKALLEYISLGAQREIGITMVSFALLLQVQGKLSEAQLQYEQTLPILRELDQIQYIKTLTNLALVRERQGNIAGARTATETALDGYQGLGDLHGEALTRVSLAKMCLAAQDLEQAADHAAKARSLAIQHAYTQELTRLEELGL